MFEGLGAVIENLGDRALGVYDAEQDREAQVRIAELNAQAETTQSVTESRSKQLLYLGIGVIGAAYLLFTLRKME